MTSRTDGLTQRFFRSVGRHFITMSCVQRPQGTNRENVLVFSGFLAKIAGYWFYVTAGHVLRDLQAAIHAGSEFDVWRLGDQTAGGTFQDTAIPFHFDPERWLVVEDEWTGLDYAAVLLDDLYCRLLEAGGAEPLDRDTWGDHVTEHDYWALVGIPAETIAYDGKTIITGRFVITPLKATATPDEAGTKSQNQFYARLGDDSTNVVSDLAGMSGGPIFSLKRTGDEWRYCVIGVQSGWYRSERIITACPFSTFAEAIEKEIETCLAELDSEDRP